MNSVNFSKSCELRTLSNATRNFEPKSATLQCNQNATVLLKVAARAVIRRNQPATEPQLSTKYSATFSAEKAGAELHPECTKNERWLRFVDLLELNGASSVEIENEFDHLDIVGLIASEEADFPKLARTVAQSIIRSRKLDHRVSVPPTSYTIQSSPKQTCGACRHFERIEHPRLGHCSIEAETEAPCGLWDADWRDHCQQFAALMGGV